MPKKIKLQKCDQHYDCFNCEHHDCISGVPFVEKEEIDPAKSAGRIIRKKYNSEEARQRNIKRCKSYKERNREKVYSKNKEWADSHNEELNYIRRKSLRRKRLEQGCFKIAGTIRYKGGEAFVYSTKYGGKRNYFGFYGKEYFEITEEDIVWMWLEKVV